MSSARFLLVSVVLAVPAVCGATQTIQVRNHTFEQHVAGSVQVLHLVGGGAAPSDGLPATAERWYVGVRGESPERLIAISSHRPSADAAKTSRTGTDAVALAIQPLVNPATGSLDVMCSLPGTESARVEVFDVMGRRVTAHDIDVVSSGLVRVRLNAGVRLAAGSYWIKLTQGSRAPVSQRVVLR